MAMSWVYPVSGWATWCREDWSLPWDQTASHSVHGPRHTEMQRSVDARHYSRQTTAMFPVTVTHLSWRVTITGVSCVAAPWAAALPQAWSALCFAHAVSHYRPNESHLLHLLSQTWPNWRNWILKAFQRRERKEYDSPCMPIYLWDVEAQSAQIWRWSCRPWAPAALYPKGDFLLLTYAIG
jgi:hypothetical protein